MKAPTFPGGREFALLARSLPVPFTTTLSRMRTDRERLLLSLFVLLIVGWGIRPRLAHRRPRRPSRRPCRSRRRR